jgi:5-methylcytosine-specific restriction endonuclease McrA
MMEKRETEIIEQSGDDDYDAAVLYYEEKGLRIEFNKRIKSLKLDGQARAELFLRFKELYEHGGFKCAYCDEKMGLKYGDNELAFTVDHIEAQVDGGTDNIFNLTFCCQSCNSMKGDKDAGWFVKNVKRLKARKRKREYWKARISSQKDKGLRDSYEQIFQHTKAKQEKGGEKP